MPTDAHHPSHEAVRARFAALGQHLARSLDEPVPSVALLPGRRTRHPARRRTWSVAAAALALLGAGTWLGVRSTNGPDAVSTTDEPPSSAVSTTAPPSTEDPWPPLAPVHEHCVEDEATRARYAGGNYPSEVTRTQICEMDHHDLPEPVYTPPGFGLGVVSSAATRDMAADDEFHAALDAHGVDRQDLATQLASGPLWDAFQNRHAVPVLDREGNQIGWWGGGYRHDAGGFVSLEDMDQARVEAEAAIAEFERTGVLPPAPVLPPARQGG